MKTLQKKTPANKNTRKNARVLAKYLKRTGIAATAPSKKDELGQWQVKANVTRSKRFYSVVNGKLI